VLRSAHTRLLALAAAGVLCAFHMSHDQREACAPAASVFAAPVGADPAVCLSTQRI
jgi:hypothetical protein